jgi:hypothetical protein
MRNVRTIAALGVAGALATGAALVGMNSAQAAPPAAVAPTPPSTSPSSPPATSTALYYTKVANTVTVYRGSPSDDVVVAKVTATELRQAKSGGVATLKVKAKKNYSISTGSFVWAGGGHEKHVAKKVRVTVKAGHTRTIQLRFPKAKGTALIFEPKLANRPSPGQYTWYRHGFQ